MKQKLGQICNFLPGNAWKSSEFKDEGIPIIRINNLKPNSTDFKYWDQEFNPKYFIEEGDILVSLSGTIKAYRWVGQKGLLNQRIVKVTTKEGVNIDWVYYQISNVIEKISNTGKEAVIRNVSVIDLKNFEVDVPDILIQNNIVTFLDKANLLIKKRAKSLELLDDFLQSKFLEMFGKTNKDFKNWDEKQIQELALDEKSAIRSGPFGSDLKHSEFKEDGTVAVLGIDNAVKNKFNWKEKRYISEEKYQSMKKYTVYPRDVIITIMGTIGKSAVIPNDIPKAINTKHLACISLDPEECNPYYLAYSIHSNPFLHYQMKSRDRGAIMSGLNLTIIKELKLKKAPIELQNQFEDIFHKIELQKDNLIKSIQELNDLFNSISQRAFSGQINIDEEIVLESLINEIDLDKDKNNVRDIATVYLRELVEKVNNKNFEDLTQYRKAKKVIFQLLESGELTQRYNNENKNVELIISK